MVDSVRDRLEKLKSVNDYKPLNEEKTLTPESIFVKKIEKSMLKIDSLRTRMTSGSDQYLSLYEELKDAEQEFLKLLDDPETKFMDFSSVFVSKVDSTKKKLITKKN